jgi:FXSXX-COOH protein
LADGPARAARLCPAADGSAEALWGGVDHPVLTEVLRQLVARETRAAGPVIAYYEDSP